MKIFFILALLGLTSCNLYGGIDKPNGDQQILTYARACLDQGKYECARNYYQALSSSYNDVKISEFALAILAQNNIFYMTDLVVALEQGTGSTTTFIKLSQIMAARGNAPAPAREILQMAYSAASTITDTTLRAYIQFISSFAVFNQVLASAVGTDGSLTASDLASNATACKSAGQLGCAASAACDMPTGSSLINTATSEATSLDNANNWKTDPSLDKLDFAIKKVDAAMTVLTGSSSGLSKAIAIIKAIGGGATVASARCTRELLIEALFYTQ